jgi:hypothetical protein
MEDCASRIRGRVQITTDGHKAYLEAVENAFGADIDYAQLQKIYGAPSENEKHVTVIVDFLQESIGKPCESPHPHAECEIRPLDIGRAPMLGVRIATHNFHVATDAGCGRIVRSRGKTVQATISAAYTPPCE